MIFGEERFFKKKHFEAKRGFAPSCLCELVVYCLELVSQLSYYNLKFRFKGGNSLLILLENPQRFSIDVDIVTNETKEKLITLVENIVNSCEAFNKFELRTHKTKPWLPMISFKLYFNSFYQKEEDAYIMLDAILEEPACEGIKKQVKCLDIYESKQIVELPSISGLIADKLLTIGPSTLGIPIGKNKEAQRLKHIFDVSLLSNKDYKLDELKSNLFKCIEQENKLQKSNFPMEKIFQDTINFCSEPLKYTQKPDINSLKVNTYLYEIVKGFDDFKRHLFRINYTWQLFKRDCKQILELINKLW
jgi:hypothetical protein